MEAAGALAGWCVPCCYRSSLGAGLVHYEGKNERIVTIQKVGQLRTVKTEGGVRITGARYLESVQCRELRLFRSIVQGSVSSSGDCTLAGVHCSGVVSWSGRQLMIRSHWRWCSLRQSEIGEVRVIFPEGQKQSRTLQITGATINKLVFANGGAWRFRVELSKDGLINFRDTFDDFGITIQKSRIGQIAFE